MAEWIDALKRGTALRFIDAAEPPGYPANGVLATSGEWVLVDTGREVQACNTELGAWRALARGMHAVGACFAGNLVVIAWSRGGLTGVDLDGHVVWSEKAAPHRLGAVRRGDRAIHRLCVSADGEIVVAYALGCIRWLDPETGRERRRLALERRRGTLREFDGETGRSDGPEYEAVEYEEIAGFDPTGRHALSWLPMLYNGAHKPGDLLLRDFASGSCTTVKAGILRPGTMLLGPGARWALAWSAWASIDLWDLVGKERLGSRPVSAGTSAHAWGPTAALSPDGRHWVSAVAREICLWETSAESPIDRLVMPAYPPVHGPIAFSQDGRTLYLSLEGHVARLAVDPGAADR